MSHFRFQFRSSIFSVPLALAVHAAALTSPNGKIEVNVSVPGGRLSYEIKFNTNAVIETSPLGISVGGSDLGAGATLGAIALTSGDETYPVLGKKALGLNKYNGNRIAVTSNSIAYQVEVRAFDDGVAFRYIVPGTRTVNGEATSFTFPAGSRAYFQPNVTHYEGDYVTKDIAAVTTSDVSGPPLTIKLPGTQGYAAVSEGALIRYSGMSLRGAGNRAFKANFANAIGSVQDSVLSPWRIIMIAADLNGLVNCDVVQNVAAAPDPALFPQGANTDWVRPGRVSWSWMASDYNAGVNPENMRAYSDNAAKLGWEYNIVDDGWKSWGNAWTAIKDLSTYAKAKKVGTMAWVNFSEVNTEAKASAYFKQASDAGLAGLKIDFMDKEARDIIDWFQIVYRLAAQNKLLLDFHGAGKPTGQERTYPNEMTREAIKGREYGSSGKNDLYYPFARYLAGHADYTPMWFKSDKLQGSTHAHQIASAIVFTSPLMVYCENPATVVAHAAVDIIKAIPSTWDETRVLPPSEINDVAVFARRKGNDWFLAGFNAGAPKTLSISLSFLKGARYNAKAVRDVNGSANPSLDAAKSYTPADAITVTMNAWGGFAAQLVDANPTGILLGGSIPNIISASSAPVGTDPYFDLTGRRHSPGDGKAGNAPGGVLRVNGNKLYFGK